MKTYKTSVTPDIATKNQNALIAAIVAVIEENPQHPEVAEIIITGTLETLLEPYRERNLYSGERQRKAGR